MRKDQVFRKILCLMGIAVFLIVAVPGCSKVPSQQSSESNGSTASQVVPLKEVTLSFYFPGEARRDMRLVLDEIEKKLKDTVNAKLVFNFVPWADYDNKISVLIVSGDNYDAHMDAEWSGFPTLSQKGALLDITELFPEFAPNLYKKYKAEDLAPATVNNKLMAIPWLYPMTDRRAADVREDLKKKYNIPDIATLEDFEFYMKTIKENEPDIIPFTPNYDRSSSIFGDMKGYAVLSLSLDLVYKWDDPDMKIVAWEQTPEYKQVVEMMRSWYEKDYMPKDVNAVQDFSFFGPGKISSTIYLWMEAYTNFDKQVKAANPGWSVKAYDLYPDKVATKSSPMNNAMAFNVNAANPDRALMFMEWIQASQENYDLMIYGIKDKHYELEGKFIKQPAGYNYNDNPYLNWEGQWPFWNIEYFRFDVNDPVEYKEGYFDNVNHNTRYRPHLGFTPNLDPIKTEVAQRTATYGEMGKLLEYGALPMDKFDSYIQKQKDAGTEKIVTEIQKQLDAWKAANKK